MGYPIFSGDACASKTDNNDVYAVLRAHECRLFARQTTSVRSSVSQSARGESRWLQGSPGFIKNCGGSLGNSAPFFPFCGCAPTSIVGCGSVEAGLAKLVIRLASRELSQDRSLLSLMLQYIWHIIWKEMSIIEERTLHVCVRESIHDG